MNDRTRMITTLGMWFFIALLIGSGYDTPVGRDGGQLIAIAVILAIAGAVSTRFIWSGGEMNRSASRQAHVEKAKRSPQHRIDRLIDALDDDELDMLRQRLIDEQPATLEELLSDYERD